MMNTNRTEGLRALIRQGLQAVAHKDTLAHLGDRSSYVGMSDIGPALGMPTGGTGQKGAAHHKQPGASAYSATRALVRIRGWASSGSAGPACTAPA